MRESLRQIAAEAGIDNITMVAKRWEEAEVHPADVVISAHVIYMIEDIQAFVVKLVEHAREQVFMPTFMRPPMARYAPFWRWVHGEDRVELPGAAEFMQVLWEMGIYPNLEMFAPEPFRALKDWQTALTTLRQRMYVEPDTDADARLQQAMHELLVETAGWLCDAGNRTWALGFDLLASRVGAYASTTTHGQGHQHPLGRRSGQLRRAPRVYLR